MPKVGMEPIRRDSVIRATIHEIGRSGSRGVTVGQIAKRAGVSTALVHHYFGSKDQVIIAAMRHILTVYRDDVRAALAQAKSPEDRIRAIAEASFSDENFESNTLSAWLNFYLAAQNSAEAKRLLGIYQRRIVSNLTHALRPIVGDRAKSVAECMAALVDGIYLRVGLGLADPDPDLAVRMALDLLQLEKNRTFS